MPRNQEIWDKVVELHHRHPDWNGAMIARAVGKHSSQVYLIARKLGLNIPVERGGSRRSVVMKDDISEKNWIWLREEAARLNCTFNELAKGLLEDAINEARGES